MFNTLSRSLVSLVFPSTCDHCGSLVEPHLSGLCASCKSGLSFISPPHCPDCGRTFLLSPQSCEACRGESFAFDRAYACTAYEGTIKKMLQAYKFEGRKSHRHLFVDLLADFTQRHINLAYVDALVAVPMNPRKERDRGFNQAALLAALLAKRIGKPFIASALDCHKSLIPQSSLGKSDRKQHVLGAFVTRKPDLIRGRSLLLVDDILTTGQTASECARALKNGGASTVVALTVARGL